MTFYSLNSNTKNEKTINGQLKVSDRNKVYDPFSFCFFMVMTNEILWIRKEEIYSVISTNVTVYSVFVEGQEMYNILRKVEMIIIIVRKIYISHYKSGSLISCKMMRQSPCSAYNIPIRNIFLKLHVYKSISILFCYHKIPKHIYI